MRSPITHFILMFVVGVLSALGYIFWYSIVSDESTKVASLQDQAVAVHEAADRVALARATLSDTAADEVNVRSYFVPESGVVTFISYLEALARAQKATINVQTVSAGGSVTRPTLQFSLMIGGAFDAVMRTIGAIEYAPYALSIPTVSVQQDDKGIWRADLKLIVGSTAPKTTTP